MAKTAAVAKRAKRNKEIRNFAIFVAFAAFVFGITAIRLILGNVGWMALTLGLCGASFAAGWFLRPTHGDRQLPNSAYGKVRYRGGQFPPESDTGITEMNARSAYPPGMVAQATAARIREDIARRVRGSQEPDSARERLLSDPYSGAREIKRKDT